ncbi:MAG: caspase family protein [Chitinophagaceae bacterium]|nr:caspase family protein [Chitinophagaceae bacterium]
MRKALIVGINEYPGRPLRGCVNDANMIADLLATNEDDSINFDVVRAHNLKTKDELRSRIYDLFKHDDEISLFYFSGHGSITKYGGYLITPDFTRYDIGISMDEILTIASLSPARHKIVILDCCYSGAMGSPAMNENTAAFLAKGVTVLAASRDDEPSLEVAGHGVFTNLLANGLKGGAADIPGEVRPGNLYSYIDKALGAWQQRPVFKANIVESVCLRKVKPQMPLKDLRRLIEYFPTPDFELTLDASYEYTSEEPNLEHIEIFKILRRFQVLQLLEPIGEEYMYLAAINRKSCRLTSLGKYHWHLIKNRRL